MSVRDLVLSAATGLIMPTAWTFTYSSIYAGVTPPTQARMSDGNSNTYWGSNSGANWLMADFGSPKLVSRVMLRAVPASAPGGWGVNYLNGRVVQSADSPSGPWTNLLTISGTSETVTTTHPLTTPVTAQYIRISGTGYTGASEFYFE